MTSAPPPIPPSAPPPVEPPAWAPPPPPPPPSAGPPVRSPLHRSTDDKVIGGVCGGLGEYTGIDPLLWRIGFVALALAGGSGVLVYLLLWLFMPGDPSPSYRARTDYGSYDRGPAPARSPIPRLTVALLLIVLGVLALLTRFTGFDPGPRGFLGGALLIVGLALVVTAFSEVRRARVGLIVLGMLLSVALLAVSSAPWHGVSVGVGDRTYQPATAADVHSEYRGGVGDVTLDLTHVNLADRSGPITTRLDHGVGDLHVLVPADADVRVTVHNGLGNVDVFGNSNDSGFFPGTGSQSWVNDGQPEFDLTINAGIGDVEVSRG